MSPACPRCGAIELDPYAISCGVCGEILSNVFEEDLPPYSGTVNLSASSCMVHDNFQAIRSHLDSLIVLEPDSKQAVEKAIEQLNLVETYTYQQDELLSQKKELEEFSNFLEEYKVLVDEKKEEPTYQTFLAQNPSILHPQVKKCYPKYKLGRDLIPDYLLILEDSTHLFVEIEKPSKKIFNQDGSESRDYRTAFKQVRDFVIWARDELSHLRKRECPNITSSNIIGLLVIGNNSDLAPKDMNRLEHINADYGGRYIIKTFDQLYEDSVRMLENIRTY